jgi:hypothetical protein
MTIPTTRFDLLTGEPFVPKRDTQKFATRGNAIKYNNLKAKERREEIKYIQVPLKLNFEILKNELGKEPEKIFSVNYLLGAKFNFAIHTHRRTVGNVAWPCIYNFMIEKIDRENIKIVRYD